MRTFPPYTVTNAGGLLFGFRVLRREGGNCPKKVTVMKVEHVLTGAGTQRVLQAVPSRKREWFVDEETGKSRWRWLYYTLYKWAVVDVPAMNHSVKVLYEDGTKELLPSNLPVVVTH